MAYQSVFRAGQFQGQTIIVTGGGSGIGRCTAHELASLGAHVVLTGRKRDQKTYYKHTGYAGGIERKRALLDLEEPSAEDREALF